MAWAKRGHLSRKIYIQSGRKILGILFFLQPAKPNNKCECPCCTHWRTQVVRGIAVPSHVRDLLDILLCEREVAPPASGYVGVYPFFKPSCCIPWMTHKDKAFCERELGTVEPCKICGTVPLFAGSDCTFTAEDAEVMYQRYVTVPRKVNGDKNVEEDKPTKKTTRDVIEWHRVQRMLQIMGNATLMPCMPHLNGLWMTMLCGATKPCWTRWRKPCKTQHHASRHLLSLLLLLLLLMLLLCCCCCCSNPPSAS